ncbi:hypothetical protein [Zobellella aerophila]|uniref:Uncharacterized protein n=1 Tax=Zobellella aerophila TaxID=870480 RepID=A0ABP6VBW5_9GAMM
MIVEKRILHGWIADNRLFQRFPGEKSQACPIADPDRKNRLNTRANRNLSGRFTCPFFTIKNVAKVDDKHLLVTNDHNPPGSTGRRLNAADSEFILLDAADFLKAR